MPDMPSVNWNTPGSLAYAGAQRVYIRQRWADAWSLQPQIFCSQATWSLLPSMPVAQLEMDYGRVLPHGGINWTNQAKINLGGWYVKIEFDCNDGTLVWVGFVDDTADEQGGTDGGVASGTLRWVAYGMPQVLAYEYMTRCRWYDEPNTENRWSGSAISFNARGKPNRTATAPTADPDKEEVHLFSPTAPKNIGDSSPWAAAAMWSSRDIVSYLQEHGMPTDQDGTEKIPFRIDGQDILPDWDKPTIETEGKPVLSVLNEIINPGRLTQLSTRIDESTTPHTVVMQIHSLSSVELSLPDSKYHPANANQLTIQAIASHDTKLTIQKSETQTVHQVVVKGAKRETCATFQVASSGEALIPGWTSSEESAYESAASGETGYSAGSDEEKRQWNHLVRTRPAYADVFRAFVINPAWDFDVGTFDWLFEDDDSQRYYPWFDDITISPVLPLKEGLDYTGTLPEDDDATPEYRPPYVTFERPGTSPAEYVQAEKMATEDGDPIFSVEIGMTKDNKGITLDVIGANQHAIADTHFLPLAADTDDTGAWDYLDAKFTLSWTEDRYAEFNYPEEENLPVRDAIRRKVIYAGEGYRRIRIKNATVVGTDIDGAHETTAAAGWLTRDDEGPLQSIGQIAASWHLVPRKVLRLNSARPSATPAVGQLLTVTNYGTPHAETINSIVSEISISVSRSDTLQAAQYSLTTAIGELDPLAFVPNNQRAI